MQASGSMAATNSTATRLVDGGVLPRDALVTPLASQPSGSVTAQQELGPRLSSSIGAHAAHGRQPGVSLTLADAAAAGSLVVGPTGLPSIQERMQRWLQQDELAPVARRYSRIGSTTSLDSTAMARQASSAAAATGTAGAVSSGRASGTGSGVEHVEQVCAVA